ncbi:hypothetical protein GCM10010495_82180 [Kitasatospora herbaricolor]|nr:hypothetical protein GCM10010495_82180 [Kitasatospora herbaricolor]
MRKFSKRWFGSYVIITVHDNAIYLLRELDGTKLKILIAGKRVKIFKRRHAEMNMEDFNEGTEIPQQEDESDMDNEGDEDELDKDVGDIF